MAEGARLEIVWAALPVPRVRIPPTPPPALGSASENLERDLATLENAPGPDSRRRKGVTPAQNKAKHRPAVTPAASDAGRLPAGAGACAPLRATRIVAVVVTAALLLTGLALLSVGCSGSTATTSATTSLSESTTLTTAATSSTTLEATTSTTLPSMITPTQLDLANTAKVMQSLLQVLQAGNVSKTDPRLAIIYGLRARENALSARQAIDDNNPSIADTAVQEVNTLMNLGTPLAQGETATLLNDASKTIANLGQPSDALQKAAPVLDQFIAQLKPLIDEANALLSSSTTSST